MNDVLHKQKRREESQITLKTLWGPSMNPVLNIDEQVLNFRKIFFWTLANFLNFQNFHTFYILFEPA